MSKNLICIVCPRGCHLSIDVELNVTGNGCIRGEKYAKQEVTMPKRTITSTVKLVSKDLNRLPIKTSGDIPKTEIFNLMEELKKVKVEAPVKIGDVVVKDILGLGVDIISCRNVEK